MAKRKVRIRAKRLDELDETKLSLAIYLLARDLVDDQTTQFSPEPEETNDDPSKDTA
jgi:hypothetical protein